MSIPTLVLFCGASRIKFIELVTSKFDCDL
jgi:hypothetical protein